MPEDFFKGKSLPLKVLIGFQELTLHEFVMLSSKGYTCLKRTIKIETRKNMKEEFKLEHFEKIKNWVLRFCMSNFPEQSND